MSRMSSGDFLLMKLDQFKVDVIFVLVSGVTSLVTTFNMLRNTHLPHFRQVYVSSDERDVLLWMTGVMCVSGLVGAVVAAVRLTYTKKITYQKFFAALLLSLLANFTAGIILSEHKKNIHHTLDYSMSQRLTEAVVTREQLGVGFAINEAWDYLQIKMHCCGVEDYKDYFTVDGFSGEMVLPQSCCVMKTSSLSDVMVENPSQCRLDAVHRLQKSGFLHTQGCFPLLSRWLSHYLAKITTLLFFSTVLQAMAILFLSWKGYNKLNMGLRPD